ncbi:hypothetical protein ACF1G0_33200 [Streptomyces sp. NPDC013953]|uniref:hypothetical protein n=1 Tax=Streptomyces sp. NPDC013953 TaxID=3364868 RepID=UPI0036F66294
MGRAAPESAPPMFGRPPDGAGLTAVDGSDSADIGAVGEYTVTAQVGGIGLQPPHAAADRAQVDRTGLHPVIGRTEVLQRAKQVPGLLAAAERRGVEAG